MLKSICYCYCIYHCKLDYVVLWKWLLMFLQTIGIDMPMVRYSLVVFCSSVYYFALHIGVVSGWGSSICAPTHLPLSGSGWSVISSLCFPGFPPFLSPVGLSQLLAHSLYSAGCEVSSHLATQTDTFLQQAEPSESGSAWSASSCALRSKLWAIRSPLGSIIHVQGAWTTQLRVQYIQTICLMTQPSAWSNCILPHSVVSFSETKGPVISILPCSLCFVMDGWSVVTLSQHCNCLIFGWLPV